MSLSYSQYSVKAVAVDSTDRNSDILGRIVLVGILSFLLVKYNYEISQFLMSRADLWWDSRALFLQQMERAVDDSGILGTLILGILYIILTLLSAVLFGVVCVAVWLVGKLNDIYVLPFILAVLAVYSKFSYAFVVRPFVQVITKTVCVLPTVGRLFVRAFELFIVIPIAEVISSDLSPVRRLYRAGMALLFIIGTVSLTVGVCGIVLRVLHEKNVLHAVASVGATPKQVGANTPTQEQHQIEVQGSHPYWTETGIFLRKGDMVSFTAMGAVGAPFPSNKKGVMKHPSTGPNGLRQYIGPGEYMTPERFPQDERLRGYSPANYILPNKPLNSLMGKVGTGNAFYIGKSKEYKAKYDGEILMGINQLWLKGAWQENTGSFRVTIIVGRR